MEDKKKMLNLMNHIAELKTELVYLTKSGQLDSHEKAEFEIEIADLEEQLKEMEG